MGYFVGLPLGGAAEKDCQVRFGKNMTFQVETRAPHLPAEWALQSGIQLTWPHAGTDWTYMLDEVQECFVAIAHEIAARETLLIVTPEPDEVKKQILGRVNMENVRFLKCETNIGDCPKLAKISLGKNMKTLEAYCFVGSFLVSTVGGSILAGILVFTLQKSGALKSMRAALEH